METKPVTDLSSKVVSVARAIDRLPPGEYAVKIIKPTSKTGSWIISIDSVTQVQTMTVPARMIVQNNNALADAEGTKI